MDNIKIAVIGLGYVGLPLVHTFLEKYEVVLMDIKGIVKDPAWRL